MSMTKTSGPALKVVEIEDYMQDPLSSDEDDRQASTITDLEKLSRPTTTNIAKKRPSPVSDSDEEIFGSGLSSSQQKRPKTTAFRRPTVKYGSQSSQPSKAYGTKRGKQFRQARVPTPSKSIVKEAATFKAAKGADVFAFGDDTNRMPSPTSSILSEPPDSPEFEEIEALDGNEGLKVPCDICHAQVDLLVKQEYEDRYGENTNVRRQNAFCKYHKQHEARHIWQQQGYPEISWGRLETRMREQHPRLINILHGHSPSMFRQELAKQIASRGDRTIKTTYAGSTSSTVSTGYYGPRGQKLMLEHISAQLSDELREASLTDALISSAGVGGGVSGFVQSVLVPEMAVGLVAKDMKVTEDKARQILVDSKALGEMLHDEERERVQEADDLDTSK